MTLDFDRCLAAIERKDPRFDGWFFTGVTSTGIYCRPSCPARTPKREHLRFYATGAAAQSAGFRACLRCRPDATPGSPEWDARADLAGRAMRLIADGVVDREGVAGLARRLGYTERHLHRRLVEAVGTGPLALARAQRARAARILVETTTLPMAEIAFAAGFSSVRQFNDTIREVFARPPGELRRRAARTAAPRDAGALTLRLPYRAPLDAESLLAFLGRRAVEGIEAWEGGAYMRSLRLPHGAGIAELRAADGHVDATLRLDDLRDLGPAVERCRRLLDLDADPETVRDALGGDPLLGPLVRAAPGRRVPGHVDGDELAVRAVLGQQVTVAGARTLAGRLVDRLGERLDTPAGSVTRLFPSSAALAAVDPATLGMPKARAAALVGLTRALADGDVAIDAGADREATGRALLALPGIGPWTAAYVALRALRDPDAFLPTDLGVRRGLEALGVDGRPTAASRLAERWRPYRAYATLHLWGAHA